MEKRETTLEGKDNGRGLGLVKGETDGASAKMTRRGAVVWRCGGHGAGGGHAVSRTRAGRAAARDRRAAPVPGRQTGRAGGRCGTTRSPRLAASGKKGALTIEATAGRRESRRGRGDGPSRLGRAGRRRPARGLHCCERTRSAADGGHDTRGRCDKKTVIEQAVDRGAEHRMEVLRQCAAGDPGRGLGSAGPRGLLQALAPGCGPDRRDRPRGPDAAAAGEEEAKAWEAQTEANLRCYTGARGWKRPAVADTADLDGPSDPRPLVPGPLDPAAAPPTLAGTRGDRVHRCWRWAPGWSRCRQRAAGQRAITQSVAQDDRLEATDPSWPATKKLYMGRPPAAPGDQEVDGRVLSTRNAPLARR